MINRLMKAAVVSGGAALAVNLAIVFCAMHFFGASMKLRSPGEGVPEGMQIVKMLPESFLLSLVAAAFLFLLMRFFNNPWPFFVSFVLIVATVWTAGPFKHGADTATKVALGATHFVIAFSIIIANVAFVRHGDHGR